MSATRLLRAAGGALMPLTSLSKPVDINAFLGWLKNDATTSLRSAAPARGAEGGEAPLPADAASVPPEYRDNVDRYLRARGGDPGGATVERFSSTLVRYAAAQLRRVDGKPEGEARDGRISLVEARLLSRDLQDDVARFDAASRGGASASDGVLAFGLTPEQIESAGRKALARAIKQQFGQDEDGTWGPFGRDFQDLVPDLLRAAERWTPEASTLVPAGGFYETKLRVPGDESYGGWTFSIQFREGRKTAVATCTDDTP